MDDMTTKELQDFDVNTVIKQGFMWSNGTYPNSHGDSDSYTFKAKVIYDYDIGFSIVKFNDADFCLTNFPGKARPNNQFKTTKEYEKKLNAAFKMLTKGHYDVVRVNHMLGKSIKDGWGSPTCSFV